VFAPHGFLIASEAKPVGLGYQGTTGYYDMVVQAIALVNNGEYALTVEEVWLDVLREGRLMQRQAIDLQEVTRATGTATALLGMDFQAALDVLYSFGNLLPEGRTMAPSLTLEPGTAALVDDVYVVTRGLPDTIRVTVTARNDSGTSKNTESILPIREYQLENEYIFPVEPGPWLVTAFPGLRGHHRWSTMTEHAIDIAQVDARGSWAEGEPHAWHEGLLAAADGKVVKAFGGDEFPLETWSRRKNETWNAYQGRLNQMQTQKFLAPDADPLAVAAGNHVIIEHAGGEFSMYGHLAYGSLRVAAGDEVEQGQHIAGLGGTGEMPMVHLHFQISNGTTTGSRTFPLKFENVRINAPYANGTSLFTQPGFFLDVMK
jgi:hypothetical protein